MSKVKKLTPYKDGKKRKMVMTKLTAIALTACGANPEANVTFFKSHKSETSVEKRTVLASMEALHTHAIVIDDYAKLNKGGNTSWAGSEGNQHTHDFVIDDNGIVTIGANEGHLHFVEKTVEQITKSGLTDEQITDLGLVVEFQKDKSTANKGGKQSGNEETIMTDEQKAALKKAQDELATNKTALALAVLLGSMNDAQKAHHASLDADGQTAFLAKSVEDREAIVTAIAKAAEDDNAEVYKAHDGTVFTKKDDPRLVKMAKDGDIMAAKLAKSADLVADGEVAKRATDLFKNLSGDASAQTALLKSVDGIKDEEVRKSVMAILAKSDAGIAALTTEHGTQDLGVIKGDAVAADAKLSTLAKKYVQENPGTDAFEAYGIVSDANPELYNVAVG